MNIHPPACEIRIDAKKFDRCLKAIRDRCVPESPPIALDEPSRSPDAVVCVVSRWDQSACGGAGNFRPILLFPVQPRRAKHEPIAPPGIDIDRLGFLDFLDASGSMKGGFETALDRLA